VERSGEIWSDVERTGAIPIWSDLKRSEVMWSDLERSGTIWNDLERETFTENVDVDMIFTDIFNKTVQIAREWQW